MQTYATNICVPEYIANTLITSQKSTIVTTMVSVASAVATAITILNKSHISVRYNHFQFLLKLTEFEKLTDRFIVLSFDLLNRRS